MTPRQKVRTGCRTCKVRKVKCDENKPRCTRCVTSRRKCGGYEMPVAEQGLSWYRPTQLAARNQQEGRAYQFFTSKVGPVLAGSTDTYFWTHLVMQFSHFEPSVRHVVLSISSLFDDFGRGSRITSQKRDNLFAIRNYNSALSLAQSASDPDLILLLCILFVCIEFLQGDFDMALRHCRYGITIMNRLGCGTSWASEHLLPIFRRLSLIPFFFGGANAAAPVPSLIGFDAPTSGGFERVSQAQSALDSLMGRVMGLDKLDVNLPERHGLQLVMDEWLQQFELLKEKLALTTESDKLPLFCLEIKHKVVQICLDTPFGSPEMAFDQHLDKFLAIVQLARSAVRCDASTISPDNIPPKGFAFEMGLLPLFSFAVIKCRNLQIRLDTLSLMVQLCTAKEGLFDVGTLYRVGLRLVEIEHGINLAGTLGGQKIDGDHPFPPEADRIFASPVDHLLQTATLGDGTRKYRRRVRFLKRDIVSQRVLETEEYITDESPKLRDLNVPNMRSARL